MGLLVEVAIVAESIVSAAWARAAANRERLRRRQDVQANREKASKQKLKDLKWEELYQYTAPSKYKPEEPVAIPVPEANGPAPIIIGGLHYSSEDFERHVDGGFIHVWSADGLAEAVATTRAGGDFLYLPIGGKACVFTTTTGNVAFYVDETSARLIPKPAGLTSASSNYYFGSAVSLIVSDVTYAAELATPAAYFWFVPANFSIATTYGASVPYSIMRSLVNPIIRDLRLIVPVDNLRDDPGVFEETFLEITQPYVLNWTGADPPDDGSFTPVPDTDPRWTTIDATVPVNGQKPIVPSNVNWSYPYRQLFWDWGLPGFCRAQLLALGFRPEDLLPP
jgi:hypothetical protein